MSKALLVIALVAASFAGGAVINGPGAKWVKTLIGSRLQESDSIPTLDLDGNPPRAKTESDVETSTDTSTPSSSHRGIPSVPAPPLGESLPPQLPKIHETKPEPSPPIEAKTPEKASTSEEKPFDVISPPVIERTSVPTNLPSLPTAQPVGVDTAVAQASTPLPFTAVNSWDGLRKRMKTLGVTKYWTEGTPTGAVKFRCSVPLAGSESVSQQFEAEGDDDLKAAEAALRRIALWQATEKP